MTEVAKIIEIIGSSDKSWEDAAQVDEAIPVPTPTTIVMTISSV